MTSLKEEFISILSRYQGILYKVSLVYFRNENDRQDNFQEIAYQLWKSFPGLKNRESIGSWIYAVAINTSISNLRRASKVEFRESLPDFAGQADLVEKIVEDEHQNLLINAIQRLDAVDKSIALLYLEERSYKEIAEIIGISANNVGVRINRIKEELKNKLKF